MLVEREAMVAGTGPANVDAEIRRTPLWLPPALLAAAAPTSFIALVLGSSERWLRWPSTALALGGALLAASALVMTVRIARQRKLDLAGIVALTTQGLLGLAFTVVGAGITLLNAAGGFRRGRQLRARGKLQLPPLGHGTGWITQALGATADAADARAVADQWRENGRTEHASVAAFARLTLDLMGLGAPPKLIELAQKDGLDEIHHAEACFSLAKAIDGREVGPVDFPAAGRAKPRSRIRSVALAELALDSLVEGALHEGLSARIVARLARDCEDPHIQPVLEQIAEDEGRHAAHAWDVLEWCVAEGGTPVRAAIDGALSVLPEALESSQPAAAKNGAWLRYGIHGEELDAEAYPKARASVVRRARALVDRS